MALSSVAQDIYDQRLSETHYSGTSSSGATGGANDDPSIALVQALKHDYSRLKSNFVSFNSEGITRGDYENKVDWDSVTQVKRFRQSVDNLVAPLSKRQPVLTRAAPRSFSPVAEWEGFVEAISDASFSVRLVKTSSTSALPEDEAIFDIEDLSEYQRQHLEVGAVVRWVVGLERLASDQRRRVSEIHFRRLPAHSKKQFEKACSEAKEFLDDIKWDE